MGLQQDFQTREKIFSVRLNGLKKLTLRSHECPRRGTADGRSPGGEGSEQHSSSAPGRSEAGPQGPASPSSAGQEQPRLLVCSLWLRHVKGWRDCTDKAPARPRTGPRPEHGPALLSGPAQGQRHGRGRAGAGMAAGYSSFLPFPTVPDPRHKRPTVRPRGSSRPPWAVTSQQHQWALWGEPRPQARGACRPPGPSWAR